LGGGVVERRQVEIGGLEDNRCIVVIEKLEDTPSKYPRRPGIPQKRPLR
jgi:16S rRNA (guanine527-N7)-methyltransferase